MRLPHPSRVFCERVGILTFTDSDFTDSDFTDSDFTILTCHEITGKLPQPPSNRT